MGISIRPLVPADWETVRLIYLDGIATGEATFETIAPSWERWDSTHHRFARLVAMTEEDGLVKGWAALSPVSARSVYAGVAEVSVYVEKDSRGKGLGKVLLEQLIVHSEQNQISLQASVFPENRASVELHKSCGFREVGIRMRIGKREGHWRDTMLMERRSSVVGID
ncbi:MAG: GNAT family N-acetyltransferase [Pyrinomonadaceae bacterium]